MSKTHFSVLTAALCACVVGCPSLAVAQTVQDISGTVLLTRAGKSQPIKVITRAPVGSTVSARANGGAVIVYPDGCRQEVAAGTTVRVERVAPCAVAAVPVAPVAPAAVGPVGLFGSGLVVPVIAVGSAVGLGLLIANADDNDKPTSP